MNKNLRIALMLLFVVVFTLISITLVIALKKIKQKEENILYNTLTTVTKDYYKEYFYKYILGDSEQERIDRAKGYKNTGITITLNELAKYKVGNEDSILSQFTNYRTGNPCDYNKTKITMYPVEPYGEDNIRIETNIVCGF